MGRRLVSSVVLRFWFGNLRSIEIEHEQPNGGRQIRMLPRGIDPRHQARQSEVVLDRDLPQCGPKRILEADAGLVARDND